jgi:hypothetical protein
MSLLAALALLVASQPPQVPAEHVTTTTTTTTALPRFPAAMAPPVVAYLECLNRPLLGRSLTAETVNAVFESGISGCTGARESARNQANELLKADPEWADVTDRLRAIVHVFDEIDADHRSRGRQLLDSLVEFQSGTGSGRTSTMPRPAPAAAHQDGRPALVQEHIGREELNILRFAPHIEEPMGEYGNCIAAAEGGLPPSFPNPAVHRGGDCTPFRQAAAREADRLLQAATRLTAAQRAQVIEANLQNAEAFMAGRPVPNPNAHRLPDEVAETPQ